MEYTVYVVTAWREDPGGFIGAVDYLVFCKEGENPREVLKKSLLKTEGHLWTNPFGSFSRVKEITQIVTRL